ncbi:MAG: hypothetical protein C0624_10770 [Desulfuromonas sp.]|nr:MAG: hypothetical protein C0624_10770 [Desulfuromonas sp.]
MIDSGNVNVRLGTEQREPASWGSANLTSLKYIWHYVTPYRNRLLLAGLASLPLAALGGGIPCIFKRVTELFGDGTPLSVLLLWMVGAVLAITLRSGFEVINTYLLTILHAQLNNDIRNDLYAFLQKSSLELHNCSRSGELASLISNDSQSAAAGVIELYSFLWLSPFRVLMLVGVMLYFNPLLSLMAMITIPILSYLVTITGKKAQKAERSFLNRQGQILGWMIESLVNIRQVKAFNLHQTGQDKFESYGRELIHFRKKAVLLKAIVSPASEVTNGLALIAMVALAYHQLEMGQTTPGAIVGCLTAAISLKSPIKSLSASVLEVQKSVAAVQRIKWLIGDQGEEVERQPFHGPVTSIAIRGVGFSYDGKHNVLQQVNLDAVRGERIAIIGPSGAGKTTLLDLLSGFYPCSEGEILANDVDMTSIEQASWSRQIGIVSQEPFLFDASIEENIRHGNAEATDDDVTRAVELSGCQEILARLPNGLQTRVGERGLILSGGERKRVALARALVRPISILILDEATSELDGPSESAILDAVDQITESLIVFHISHRPGVLDHCDRAFMLQERTLREMPVEQCKAQMQSGAPRVKVGRRTAS